jgi:hypothetical protein
MQQIISIRSISLEHHRVLLVTMPRAHVDVARHLEHDRDLHTHEKKLRTNIRATLDVTLAYSLVVD